MSFIHRLYCVIITRLCLAGYSSCVKMYIEEAMMIRLQRPWTAQTILYSATSLVQASEMQPPLAKAANGFWYRLVIKVYGCDIVRSFLRSSHLSKNPASFAGPKLGLNSSTILCTHRPFDIALWVFAKEVMLPLKGHSEFTNHTGCSYATSDVGMMCRFK